jgi:hypothetical protein
LVDEFVEIKIQMSELEKKDTWLKEIFLEYIKKKDPDDDKWNYLLQWSAQDVKISQSPKYTVLDKQKFISQVKELWLFDKYADITRQKVNDIFTKSWEANINDFKEIVKEESSYRIGKVKKK